MASQIAKEFNLETWEIMASQIAKEFNLETRNLQKHVIKFIETTIV